MHPRHATPTLALLATLGLTGTAPGVLRQGCALAPETRYHGQLTQPLTGSGRYSYTDFRTLVTSREWLPEAGVTRVRRRGDCGPRCIYRGANSEREDAPATYTRASNHPICDASRVSIPDLPEHGVLIGRLTYDGQGAPSSVRGDASYNLTSRRPLAKGRLRDHYVVITPGKALVDKNTYAIWRLVASWEGPSGRDGEYAVVDSGLFRVCLPLHMTNDQVLASFRSCAEVAELHALSRMPQVQQRVLPTSQDDSVVRQARTFALLVRGDSAALDALALVPDSVKFGGVKTGGDLPPDEDARHHGPFAAATSRDASMRRRLLAGRYGELHIDAPFWYTCIPGCCTGEPW